MGGLIRLDVRWFEDPEFFLWACFDDVPRDFRPEDMSCSARSVSDHWPTVFVIYEKGESPLMGGPGDVMPRRFWNMMEKGVQEPTGRPATEFSGLVRLDGSTARRSTTSSRKRSPPGGRRRRG